MVEGLIHQAYRFGKSADGDGTGFHPMPKCECPPDVRVNDWLKSQGFDPDAKFQLGNHLECDFELWVHEREVESEVARKPLYFVIIWIGDTRGYIYCQHIGDLLELLRKYGPIAREFAFSREMS